MSTAVCTVMCSEPAMRAPLSGWLAPNSSRSAIRPGISCSARRIWWRPASARHRSANLVVEGHGKNSLDQCGLLTRRSPSGHFAGHHPRRQAAQSSGPRHRRRRSPAGLRRVAPSSPGRWRAAVDVRLEVDAARAARATASRTRPSAASMARGDLGGRVRAAPPRSWRRPAAPPGRGACVRMWMTRSTPGRRRRRAPRAMAAPARAWRPRRAAGSSSRPRGRPRRPPAARRCSAVPTPSQMPLPVSRVSPTPNRAKTRPISAAKSSSSTTGSSGALARADELAPTTARPRIWLRLADRGAEGEALQADRRRPARRPAPTASDRRSARGSLRPCATPRTARTGRRR